jgi:anti-sigma regulatory factor (Ser/Thr protein kinase)
MPYYRCADCGVTSYSAAAYSSADLCPTCLAELHNGSELHVVPGARRDVSRRLVARPEAAAEARREMLALALPEATREDLALIVTELVTNSVLHAGLSATDHVELDLTNAVGSVRLAVHDPGPGFMSPSPPPMDSFVPGGRGLVIVAALSDSWGIECDERGCTVWSQLPVAEPPAGRDRPRKSDRTASPALSF